MRNEDVAERKTKIVCTLGPVTSSEDQIRGLIEAGMNVARLNFSHGDHRGHKTVIDRVRRLAEDLEVPVAILQDLAGPKIRIGLFEDDTVDLEKGQSFTLTTRDVPGTKELVSVSYPLLPREVKSGDRLLLADGTIELEVKRVAGEEIHCQVVYGGRLSSRKGINSPTGLLGIPILGKKDIRDLQFGLHQEVDYVGLSFVRTSEDVRRAKEMISTLGGQSPVIAKIETQLALRHFGEILDEADGIMIARGDLSIETPFSRVPVLQKELIKKANERSKPVITATQMLWSMVENPHPTRAEVADVANAVMDGSDAVMLSDETAVGRYAVDSVRTMDTIVKDTEGAGLRVGWMKSGGDPAETHVPSVEEEVARIGCHLAASINADVIATFTASGETARFVAKYRPNQPILAITPELRTYRRLSLVRGVIPHCLTQELESPQDLTKALVELKERQGWSAKKAVLVSRDSVITREL